MSLSLQKENLIPETGDRRLFSRKKLPRVVLVFFARNGWGRLVNMSEDGMAFEFSGLTDTGQVISFELVDLTQNSIQVDGRIIWTRELDKIAGMQFVDLTPESKQQIKQWLSTGKFTQTRLHDETQRQASLSRAPEETKPPVDIKPPDELQPPEAFKPAGQFKPSDELQPPDQAKPTEALKPAEEFEAVNAFKPAEELKRTDLFKPPEALKPASELKPEDQFKPAESLRPLELPLRPEKAPTRAKVVRHRLPPQPEERNPRGLTSLVPEQRPEQRPEPLPKLADPNLELWDDYYNRAHAGLDKPPIPWKRIAAALFGFAILSGLSLFAGIWVAQLRQARAEQALEDSRKALDASSSADTTARPLEVEVVDAKNKHWFLTFADRSDQRAVAPAARVLSGNSTFPAAAPQSQTVASKNAQYPPGKISAPPGKIEPARLISSVSPAYPEVARSQNIAGDVVIDALIDSTGKVSDMNVVSGPILLRQPAMESVRMSKYSPARLEGRPVSTHLLVTVRYAKQ
jgi:outer membrane biosynthesis protein TonB